MDNHQENIITPEMIQGEMEQIEGDVKSLKDLNGILSHNPVSSHPNILKKITEI